ncbi:MAG: glucose 1-dehydrogenase [Acidimicrobiia bacterium]|nr:glucose 1-dehydrogenase [Acidimicrobiia bacterium]
MELPQFSLEGKVAVVTGASRGIGEATAVLLAKVGADVVVVSRDQDQLERVAHTIGEHGRRAVPIAAHLGRLDQLAPVIDRTVAELGRLDVLVNNAGTNFFAPAIDMDERGWDSIMNLDLKGLFFLSQAAARYMKDNGGGTIVNVSSLTGIDAQLNTGHYSIAKAGVIMATKVMALEWAAFGIRVNSVAPGMVDTRLLNAALEILPADLAERTLEQMRNVTPMGRLGEPSEIADAILYLATPASSYVTGQTFAVDGGAALYAATNAIRLDV